MRFAFFAQGVGSGAVATGVGLVCLVVKRSVNVGSMEVCWRAGTGRKLGRTLEGVYLVETAASLASFLPREVAKTIIFRF
jgi:hypothetical protein